MANELMKIPVNDVPGWFACSNGKIWSDKANRFLEGRVLKGSGYVQVGTQLNGKVKLFREHILICKAFHGLPVGNNNTVNHINNIKADNRPENLEWLSLQDNIKHSILQNRRMKKVTPEIILKIRAEWKPKDRTCSTRVLAQKYKLHHSYISALCKKQYNSHI